MNSYTWNLLILMQNYYCFHNEKITIKATKQTLRQKFSVFVDGRTELYVGFPQGQPWTLSDVNNYLVSAQSKCSVGIELITSTPQVKRLKPFCATVLFLYLLKTSGFRMLYGGKEGDQRYEMV